MSYLLFFLCATALSAWQLKDKSIPPQKNQNKQDFSRRNKLNVRDRGKKDQEQVRMQERTDRRMHMLSLYVHTVHMS